MTVETDGWAELARAGTLVWTPWQALAVPAGSSSAATAPAPRWAS